MGGSKSKTAGTMSRTLFDDGPESETRSLEQFKNGRGGENLYRVWAPADGTCRAIAFCFHGLHCHSGHFWQFAHTLTKAGIVCYAIDHCDHGASSDRTDTAAVKDFNYYVDDACGWIESIKVNHDADTPAFIVGHSMGSLVAVLASHRIFESKGEGHIRATVISGFLMVPGHAAASPFGVKCLWRVTKYKKLSTALGWWNAKTGAKVKTIPIDEPYLTRDTSHQQRIPKDALHIQGWQSNQQAFACLTAINTLPTLIPQFMFPFKSFHGGDDALCLPEGAEYLVEHAGSSEKSLRVYDGFYHELLNEPEHQQVEDDWLAYMETHM